MSEPEQVDARPSPMDQGIDTTAMLAALRLQCGGQMDCVRFHFIETLAQRAQAQPDAVRQVLEGKLTQALVEYRERFEQAQSEARDTVKHMAARFPDSGDVLRGLFSAGDFRGLHRHIARLDRTPRHAPLADLVSQLKQQTSQDLNGDLSRNSSDQAELKSLRYFRDTWSKLSVDQSVTQALATGPSNAGPLNSHSLVLQSLQLMRDTAPDYLNRFMTYADALLWLDQASSGSKPTKKNSGRNGSNKKRKPESPPRSG